MAHLINRLRFEITCSDEEQAFNIRHNFAQTLQKQIEEVVDRVCSQYVSDEQSIRIETLEIDVGRLSPYSLDTNFKALFLYKFERELTEQLSKIPVGEQQDSLQYSHRETLQYFLQNGTLPWWADETDFLHFYDLVPGLLLSQSDIFRTFFFQNRHNVPLWIRVAFQFERASGIVISFFEELEIAIASMATWAEEISSKAIGLRRQNVPQRNTIIKKIVLKNAPDIFQSSDKNNAAWRIFQRNFQEIFPAGELALSQADSLLSGMVANRGVPASESSGDENVKSDSVAGFSHHENANAGTDSVTLYEEGMKEHEEKHIIKHAGIVLLAPFFRQLFTRLGLVDVSGWVSKEARYKGVHLLKYMSTGKEHPPEYTLTLEKLLCGMSISEPVPLEIIVEEREKNEALSVLHSVIEHWTAVKNTSVNGLREAFLQRDGLLTRKESNWLIQVERKTIDVLIESLPWGYSTIGLPWNTYLILVEW